MRERETESNLLSSKTSKLKEQYVDMHAQPRDFQWLQVSSKSQHNKNATLFYKTKLGVHLLEMWILFEQKAQTTNHIR